MAARFQGHIDIGTGGVTAGHGESVYFGVVSTGPFMPPFTYNHTLFDDDTADRRIRIGRTDTPSSQREGTLHVEFILRHYRYLFSRSCSSCMNSPISRNERYTEANRT